jgi:transglutaminase superfamily protein
MTRRAWAVAIFGAWALSLGWLVKREYFRSTGAKLAEAALSVPPGAQFYRLDVGGQQVGFASSTIDTLTDSIRVEDVLVLDVPSLGKLHRTTARSTAIVNPTLRLRRVDASFDGDGGQFVAQGEVINDTLLRITLVSGGDTQTSRVRLARPVVLPSLLPLRLAFGGELKPGNTYAVRQFDPQLLAERDVQVRVAAETTLVVADSADYDSTAMAWVAVRYDTVRAFRIEETSGGLTFTAWIDAQGRVVRVQTPMGFSMERSAFEIAYENFRRRDTARVARGSAAPPAGGIVAATALAARVPLDAATPEVLRVRLGGVTLGGLDLAGGRQAIAGDTLVVRRESGADLDAHYLLPAGDPSLARFLEAEPLIQSYNPRIGAQARQIVGRERNARAIAERLTHWVAEHIRKDATVAYPSAVQVLEQRAGDCNEHTVLFVALARTAGLPARTVAGVVYAEGRFYYHAWAEVYLGTWVAVDPTFDQFPADAAHLRLSIGGLARQVELTRLIGKLTLEVL